MRNDRHILSFTAALALAGAALTGCSSDTDTADTAGTAGTADSGSGDIVATTTVWADVASAVTGKDVPSIISGDKIDPHHYEPSAADLAKVREAEVLVANGGGYDASLYTVAEQDRIIHAVPLLSEAEAKEHNHDHDHEGHDHDHAHDHAHDHGDIDDFEHAWFSPSKVKEVADAVARRTGGDAGDVDKRMDAISEHLGELPHVHAAMTEPIAAPLLWGTEVHDITPEGYMASAINESEPSVQDVAAFIEEIDAGHIDFLIVNTQSTNNATEQLEKAARAAGVPIVEIRETPPEGMNFLDYFERVVDDILAAAA